MPSINTRVTSYCFTLNNYTKEEELSLQKLNYKYLIYGKEIGENGTHHLQGYIHYHKSTRFSAVKNDIPRAHVEKRKGTSKQAADYCKKDGDFYEFGEIPLTAAQASKNTWSEIMLKAQLGEHKWIMDNYPKVWINLSHKLESLRSPETEILDGDLIHEWWVGPTGTGKSRSLWQLYPNHYQKDTNKWWCGYKHQELVAIEEWSPKNECTGSQLKIWADRYPFTGQIKGGSLDKIRPRKLIVLSNYEINDCFPDSRDIDPLRRRFKVLRFPEDLNLVIERSELFKREREQKRNQLEITINEENENIEPTEIDVLPTIDTANDNDMWQQYATTSDLLSILELGPESDAYNTIFNQ